MRILITALLIFQIAGIASAEINFTIGPGEKAEEKTWTSSGKNISFSYPSDWGPEKPREDGGVQLYKAGKGWFELSLIDLPAGENLDGFSRHIIEKSKGSGWDIRLVKDLGRESIGDKTSWVHKYKHKKKKRTYYGYHFISKGNVGIRVLMVKISRKGGDVMMEMLRSLSFPQLETLTVSKPEKTNKAFGTYQKKGSVRGRVQLKNNRDKSAYPCYLSFYPAGQIKGRKNSRKRGDFKATGNPVLTATNDKGRYNVDLEEGTYLVDAYNADGKEWILLKGDVFHRSKAKKVHNCQIDNRK